MVCIAAMTIVVGLASPGTAEVTWMKDPDGNATVCAIETRDVKGPWRWAVGSGYALAGSRGWWTLPGHWLCTEPPGADSYLLLGRLDVLDEDGLTVDRTIRWTLRSSGDWSGWNPAPKSTDWQMSIGLKPYTSPCLMKEDGVVHTDLRNGLPWLLPRGTHELTLGAEAIMRRGGVEYTAANEQRITVTCAKPRHKYR